jgi:hypothetical protein
MRVYPRWQCTECPVYLPDNPPIAPPDCPKCGGFMVLITDKVLDEEVAYAEEPRSYEKECE